MKTCFCGSDEPYSRCCGPVIRGTGEAKSAEKLMRSRYSAYVLADVNYLISSTHISRRPFLSAKEIEGWAKTNTWLRLEIIQAKASLVEFKAYYRDQSGRQQVHHEKSKFIFEEQRWFYLDGVFNEDI